MENIIFTKSLDDHILFVEFISEHLNKYNHVVQLDKSEILRKEVPLYYL